MSKPNGAVLYQGPSLLNGEPIIAISTGFVDPSDNPKTGPMIQVWILSATTDPVTAAKDGTDEAICGDCPHRTRIVNGKQERVCYVQPFQAPRSIFASWQRGNYPNLTTWDDLATLHAGMDVRVGAYGDPAAVPAEVWQTILSSAATNTGYTRQWRTADPRLKSLVMASVISVAEMHEAQALGWRTFRARTADEPLEPREIICPAAPEGGKRTTCADCGICNGARPYTRNGTPQADRRANVAILVHGSGAKAFANKRIIPLTLAA